MKIVTVNIGRSQPIYLGDRVASTGIYKTPASSAIMLTSEGLVGDTIADKRHHGGPDQAVYVYTTADYDWWAKELGKALPPATFGENLTLAMGTSAAIKIGDLIQVGEAVLEVTSPRIPCDKLASKMDDLSFVKRFREAKRPGFYTRVLEPAPLTAEMLVKHVPNPHNAPTILDIFELYYDAEGKEDALRHALEFPLAERTQALFSKRLAR